MIAPLEETTKSSNGAPDDHAHKGDDNGSKGDAVDDTEMQKNTECEFDKASELEAPNVDVSKKGDSSKPPSAVIKFPMNKLLTERAKIAAAVARSRAQKKVEFESLKDEINQYRSQLNLPLLDTSKKCNTRKGKPRPCYLPPPDVLASMSSEQLSEWKKKARMLRRKNFEAEKKGKERELRNELSRLRSLTLDLLRQRKALGTRAEE